MKGIMSPVWRPFTQMKTAEPPHLVKSGEGVYLELEDGSRVVDCISSWWVNIHGHAHPVIAKAIYEQALRLEQVIFAGFTHDPAEQLAQRLLEHLPAELTSIFYSDNGSTSVEVALKMSFQYWRNRGENRRRKFIGFDGGYHGDTLGAMSLGRGATFWRSYKDIMCPVEVIPFPATWEGDDQVAEKELRSLEALRKLLDGDSPEYAAICIEPLVQGAGGMKMCRPQFLQALVRTAREFGVLVIFDEVMTGFGRTGDWFASTKSSICPDIICLSKGITGGFLPLAVTACKKNIFEAFLSDDPSKAFFHGHSYTANPLACAAALASLTLLEENSEQFAAMEKRHRNFARHLSDIKQLGKIRFCGTIAAADVTTSDGNNYFDAVGPSLRKYMLSRGFLIRPLGNTIYLMPPYCINDEELNGAYRVIADAVESIVA